MTSRAGRSICGVVGVHPLRQSPIPALTASLPASKAPDGRKTRSEQSRQRIVAAVLELVREGIAEPGAQAVAARAGLGRRTVFRLFKDMEGLYREMHAAMLRRIDHILAMPIEGKGWRARLDRLIERRVQIFEEVLPIKAAADARRSRSEFLRAEHARTNAMFRQVLLFVLPKRIAEAKTRFEALDAALSFSMWCRLRHDQSLSPAQAAQVMRALADAALGAAAPDDNT